MIQHFGIKLGFDISSAVGNSCIGSCQFLVGYTAGQTAESK